MKIRKLIADLSLTSATAFLLLPMNVFAYNPILIQSGKYLASQGSPLVHQELESDFDEN